MRKSLVVLAVLVAITPLLLQSSALQAFIIPPGMYLCKVFRVFCPNPTKPVPQPDPTPEMPQPELTYTCSCICETRYNAESVTFTVKEMNQCSNGVNCTDPAGFAGSCVEAKIVLK